MKKILGCVMGVVLAMALTCQGATFRPLPNESKADMGATHVAVITSADLAGATTNTCTITNVVTAAKQGYELVAMVLVTAFVDNATNAHASTAIIVGDGDDDNLYLTSTELNSVGTEVFLKYGRDAEAVTITNVVGTTTNTYIVRSAESVAAPAYGQKLYTAAGAITTTFTGTAAYALSTLDAGEVRLYFRVKDAAKSNP
jgi:hypothetical protein